VSMGMACVVVPKKTPCCDKKAKRSSVGCASQGAPTDGVGRIVVQRSVVPGAGSSTIVSAIAINGGTIDASGGDGDSSLAMVGKFCMNWFKSHFA